MHPSLGEMVELLVTVTGRFGGYITMHINSAGLVKRMFLSFLIV